MTELTSFGNSFMEKSDNRVGNSVMEKPDDQEPLRPSVKRSFSSACDGLFQNEIEDWTSTEWMIGNICVILTILISPYPLDPVVFGVSSIFQVLVDPLLLYVPLINEDNKCVMLHHKLKIAALVLRSYGDVRYVVRIILRVKKEWPASHSLYKIAITNAMDAVSLLPIPQVVILIFLPNMRGSSSLKILKLLNSLILLQYLTRAFYPIYYACTAFNANSLSNKTSNGFQSKGLQIAFNFLWYLLGSHVLGAFWYFFSIQREIGCWGHADQIENGSEFSTSCADKTFKNITLISNICPINPPNATIFDFGIFLYALQSGMQGSTNFPQKFLQCFSWALRNLSSFASNLNTSPYGWENCFVVVITISGLILFMYLLGHVQTYMQGMNISDSLNWKMETIIEPKILSMLSKYGLPEEMKSKVNCVVREKLKKDEDLIVENMFSILSSDSYEVKEVEDLAKEIKCSLFMDKLKKVDGLKDKSEEVLQKICEHFEPMIYGEGCCIIREGEPLDMMFFVTQGIVLTYATNNGGSSCSPGSIQLIKKEIDSLYGEELLTLAKEPSSELSTLPISAVTVKSHKKAEVFALKAADLQNVVYEFSGDLNTGLTEIVSGQ